MFTEAKHVFVLVSLKRYGHYLNIVFICTRETTVSDDNWIVFTAQFRIVECACIVRSIGAFQLNAAHCLR